MNLTVERKDGTIYSLSDLGIKTRDFVISSPEYITEYEDIDGVDGKIDTGTTIGSRKLTADLFFTANDLVDYALLRNEIFRIFLSKESFYLIDDRESGKRWEVKCNSSFKPEQILKYGMFDVDFVCANGYAESIGTTLDPKTFDSELWQFGQGLTVDEVQYTQTTTSFQIYNAGDVIIDPRIKPLTITFTGASTNLEIINQTTGDAWQYTGTTSSSDTIQIIDTRSLKNSVSVFGDTNRKLISIEKGYNNFIINGTSGSFEISFDFRFYYL